MSLGSTLYFPQTYLAISTARPVFLEIVGLLQDYIIRQKKRGYEIPHIKDAMINFGHSKETVKSAIDAVEYGLEPVFVEPFDYEKVR